MRERDHVGERARRRGPERREARGVVVGDLAGVRRGGRGEGDGDEAAAADVDARRRAGRGGPAGGEGDRSGGRRRAGRAERVDVEPIAEVVRDEQAIRAGVERRDLRALLAQRGRAADDGQRDRVGGRRGGRDERADDGDGEQEAAHGRGNLRRASRRRGDRPVAQALRFCVRGPGRSPAPGPATCARRPVLTGSAPCPVLRIRAPARRSLPVGSFRRGRRVARPRVRRAALCRRRADHG